MVSRCAHGTEKEAWLILISYERFVATTEARGVHIEKHQVPQTESAWPETVLVNSSIVEMDWEEFKRKKKCKWTWPNLNSTQGEFVLMDTIALCCLSRFSLVHCDQPVSDGTRGGVTCIQVS